MYTLILSAKSKKQLRKLDKDIQQRIGSAFERIKIRPQHYVKKLVGSPYHRLKVGEYRVILDIKKGKLIILVITIGHRKKVYKRTP